MTEREIRRALRNESLFQQALWDLRGLRQLWCLRLRYEARFNCNRDSTLQNFFDFSVYRQKCLQRDLAKVRRGR